MSTKKKYKKTYAGNTIDIMRYEKQITLDKLCQNICSKGFYTHFSNGVKSVNKLIVDNLFQRLGVSDGEFEIFLSYDEYKKFIRRNTIIELIEKNELVLAKAEIKKYKESLKKFDKFHSRFILQMEAKIAHMQNEDYEKIYKILRQAVCITVPDFEEISLKDMLLGYEELFYILECAYFKELAYNDGSSQKIYEEVKEYVISEESEDIIKAKIYPKVVCLFSEKMLSDKKYNEVLDNCSKAILYLQKSGKLYFMTELMKYKKLALEGIMSEYKNTDMSECILKKLENCKKIYSENERNIKMLEELYKEYDVMREPLSWYFENDQRELYLIGEVIKRRRIMYKLSQNTLAEMVDCDISTLSRIETEFSMPHLNTARKILIELGLSGELYNPVIVVNDKDTYLMNHKLACLMILHKYDEAYYILVEMKEKLDMSVIINKQYIGHIETAIMLNLKKITAERAIQIYKDTLKLTLSEENIFSYSKKYFSKKEIMLIYNMAITYESIKDIENALKWFSVFETYYDSWDFDMSNYIITYELVMSGFESFLGNTKKYDESNEIIHKTIYESLKCRRGNFVGSELYSLAWNMKEKIEDKRKMQPRESAIYKEMLEKASTMNCIMGNEIMENFINKKLSEFNSQ